MCSVCVCQPSGKLDSLHRVSCDIRRCIKTACIIVHRRRDVSSWVGVSKEVAKEKSTGAKTSNRSVRIGSILNFVSIMLVKFALGSPNSRKS